MLLCIKRMPRRAARVLKTEIIFSRIQIQIERYFELLLMRLLCISNGCVIRSAYFGLPITLLLCDRKLHPADIG